MKSRLVKESLNENLYKVNRVAIDKRKLSEVASAIRVLCNGEYGETYFLEEENKVLINLGDSNPFDEEPFEWFVKSAIARSYDDEKLIEVIIENEISHPGGNWIEVK